MCFQQGLPRDLRLAQWGGLEAAAAEDVADRRRRNDVADVLERAPNAVVAPARVLLRHLHYQRGQITTLLRPTRRATTASHGLAHQLAMPGENGFGRYDGRDLSE